MNRYRIRRAQNGDTEAMMRMYDHSRGIMRANGNASQWVGGYPSMAQVIEDIALGHSFIMERDGEVAATFAFIIGRDPTYTHIEDGEWEDDERPYGTIHRLATREGEHGVAKSCVEWCKRQITSLRADTHADNAIMLHLLPRLGFEYRGIIHVADGTPRNAFQMLKTNVLCKPLTDHISQNVLPRYDHFDSAHQRNHAQTVINNSLELAKHYDVETNMVYAIAAYHDTGLAEGRERHHLASGAIVRADKVLLNWFSDKQIETIAEAVEDHRASADREPRSLYGKIVAEADRDIDPHTIVRRTIQYGLAHYPNADRETQWHRTVEHLEEKYGEKGYLKLWIPESKNASKLAELRTLIADREQLRRTFESLIDELEA